MIGSMPPAGLRQFRSKNRPVHYTEWQILGIGDTITVAIKKAAARSKHRENEMPEPT